MYGYTNNRGTVELRRLVENNVKIFDFIYPFWNKDDKATFESLFIKRFYFRQIEAETVGKFKFKLEAKLLEIMPYYCNIYKTTIYNYNPIENYNMTEVGQDSDISESTSKFLDTPQNEITNMDNYLTEANKGDSTVVRNHNLSRNGNIGVTTTQQMIQQERDITINLFTLILDELSCLFLKVY